MQKQQVNIKSTSPTEIVPPIHKSSCKSSNLKVILISFFSILAVLGMVLGVKALIAPKTYTAELVSKTWERGIKLEELTTCHESGWSMPDGAVKTSEAREVKSYDRQLDYIETVPVKKTKKVPCGSHEEPGPVRDNHNGTFTQTTVTVTDYEEEEYIDYEEVNHYKNVPIYATKFYYDIDRWLPIYPVIKRGTYQDEPEYPSVTLSDKIREAGRTEIYEVTFQYTCKDKIKTASKRLFKIEWDALQVNQKYDITLQLGAIKEIKID